MCSRPAASQVLSCRQQEERQTWRGGEDGLGLGPLPATWGQGVCMCSCCCFSMGRVLGQLWAGLGLWGGQEGLTASQIRSSVLLKPRRPWCQNGPATLEETWGLGVDLTRVGAGLWQEMLGEHQGAEGTAVPLPALCPCPPAPALFEVGQEVGNGVVGPINAEALAEAQQAETGLGRAGPSTSHAAVGFLIFARHQGLLQ